MNMKIQQPVKWEDTSAHEGLMAMVAMIDKYLGTTEAEKRQRGQYSSPTAQERLLHEITK